MKAVIEFNLPEQRQEFNLYMISDQMASVIVNLDTEMRNLVKYGHNFKTVDELADHVRDQLMEIRGKIDHD